jgi:DNA-directed RNA polymerase specialized sigma24 family protein
MAMALEGSITHCIQLLKTGEQAAAQQLWERYFLRLVGLARAKLQGAARRAADEEDVALSAFDSFYQRAVRGLFPQLKDRDDLWQLLVVITVRKALDLMHHETRPTRGSGRVLVLSELSVLNSEGILGAEPTPELAAQIADECRRLLGLLGNDTLRAVALWKIEGYTNEEIAVKLGCVPHTVVRKLRAIRQLWAKALPDRRLA